MQANKIIKKFREKQVIMENEFYNLRPILGNANWALFYILIGGRSAGKSYAVTNFFVDQWKKKGIPFTWLRLTEAQSRKLLQNNAEHLVDPDLRRKYDLDLVTSGNNVYEVTKRSEPDKNGKTKILEKKLMARVFALSTYYQQKGSIYDKDFLNDPNMRYNVAIDEFQREANEKNAFDITYSLVNQLENLLRETKEKTKIFFMGNCLEDASDILCAFNFIPETFGTFKLKKKRCVIQNIEPTDAYKQRRAGSIADILMPNASTFTNQIKTDETLITKKRLIEPNYIVKFTKSKDDWFTIWDNNVVKKYNGEKKPVIAMRPYLDEVYRPDIQKQMITLFDQRSMLFTNLITFKQYQKQIELLKPRK